VREEEEGVRWAGPAKRPRPGGRGSRPAGPRRVVGPKAKKENKRISDLKKNWIFEFSKALEICRRRFRRNFDKRIFSQFF
jgi:hypothetical protein